MHYNRTLQDTILRVGDSFPVILLTGPRQVGKTTVLEELAKVGMSYVCLDELDKRELAKQDPALFLQEYPAPLIIDEIQYAPELLTYVKIYVDKNKDQNGLFWLTGSQKFHLMRNVQESLAGRVGILDMLGFSYGELSGQSGRPCFELSQTWIKQARKQKNKSLKTEDIFQAIWNGSFPRLVKQNQRERATFYRSYISTYIEKDVKQSFPLSDDIAFYNFIRATAARTAQLLNYNDLARDIGIDRRTAKAWMAILERSGLVKLLYPYHTNVTNRIIKTPKIFFLDTGLCAYLTGWSSPKTLEAGAMNGPILETYVFTEILKSYWHNGEDPIIYFYRDKDQREIDFLIESNDVIHPIEIKKTMLPSKQHLKNFSVLDKLGSKIGQGCILCLRPEISALTRQITSVPIWHI